MLIGGQVCIGHAGDCGVGGGLKVNAVNITGLEVCDFCRIIGENLVVDLVQVRQRLPVFAHEIIIIPPRKRDMVAFLIFLENERACADGIGGKIVIRQIFGRVDIEGNAGQRRQQTRIRGGCVDLDGVLVDNVRTCDKGKIAALLLVSAFLCDVVVVQISHALGGKRRAVGERYVTAQLQLKPQAVLGKLPGLCKGGNKVAVRVDFNGSFQNLVQHVCVCLGVCAVEHCKAVVRHIHGLCDLKRAAANNIRCGSSIFCCCGGVPFDRCI